MLRGTNDKHYANSKSASERDERLRLAGALANIRPQHFTETLLFDLVVRESQENAFLEEQRSVEDLTAEGSNRRERVIRSYYILSTTRHSDDRGWWLTAKFWFDRILPRTLVHREGVLAGAVSLMALPATDFRF